MLFHAAKRRCAKSITIFWGVVVVVVALKRESKRSRGKQPRDNVCPMSDSNKGDWPFMFASF